jgi:uncharacterized protein
MEELFAPPAYEWKRLSPKYRSMRQLTSVIAPPVLLTIPAVIVGVSDLGSCRRDRRRPARVRHS